MNYSFIHYLKRDSRVVLKARRMMRRSQNEWHSWWSIDVGLLGTDSTKRPFLTLLLLQQNRSRKGGGGEDEKDEKKWTNFGRLNVDLFYVCGRALVEVSWSEWSAPPQTHPCHLSPAKKIQISDLSRIWFSKSAIQCSARGTRKYSTIKSADLCTFCIVL